MTRSLVAALPAVTLPTALALVSDFREGRMVGLPKRTAKFQFLFSVLLTVGLLVPSPSRSAQHRCWLPAPGQANESKSNV